MPLSNNAQQVMSQLAKAYVAQGFPPRNEFCFQMPQAPASELEGHGLIEAPQPDTYVLTEPGHAWVMAHR